MYAPHTRIIYEFGDFRLDETRRLLFAKGATEPLPLPPQALETILYFVEHAGELLTKEQLMAELWPSVVVEESSLTHVISVLRHALGETRGENRYIVTAQRRGYRFVADVRRLVEAPGAEVAASALSPASAQPASADAGTVPRARVFATTAALACLLGAIVLAYAWHANWLHPRGSSAPRSAEVAPTTELPPRSIAVLAFDTLSSDPRTALFAMGLAEAILHQLASVADLEVVAGPSSLRFSPHERDARELGMP